MGPCKENSSGFSGKEHALTKDGVLNCSYNLPSPGLKSYFKNFVIHP